MKEMKYTSNINIYFRLSHRRLAKVAESGRRRYGNFKFNQQRQPLNFLVLLCFSSRPRGTHDPFVMSAGVCGSIATVSGACVESIDATRASGQLRHEEKQEENRPQGKRRTEEAFVTKDNHISIRCEPAATNRETRQIRRFLSQRRITVHPRYLYVSHSQRLVRTKNRGSRASI